METLKIHKEKPQSAGVLTIRINRDAYDVAAQLAAESGKSIGQVCSLLVLFAAEYAEVVEE